MTRNQHRAREREEGREERAKECGDGSRGKGEGKGGEEYIKAFFYKIIFLSLV